MCTYFNSKKESFTIRDFAGIFSIFCLFCIFDFPLCIGKSLLNDCHKFLDSVSPIFFRCAMLYIMLHFDKIILNVLFPCLFFMIIIIIFIFILLVLFFYLFIIYLFIIYLFTIIIFWGERGLL